MARRTRIIRFAGSTGRSANATESPDFPTGVWGGALQLPSDSLDAPALTTERADVKGLIIAGATVVVLAGLGALVGPTAVQKIRDAMPKPQSTVVRLAQPERGVLIETIRAPGEIEPRTKVDISARLSARITALPFKEGDLVTRGNPEADPPVPASLLVQLDSTDREASLRAAEARRAADAAAIEVHRARLEGTRASIDGTRASLRQAELDLQRNSGLLATHDVAQSVVDQAGARVDELRASLASQEQALKADELNLTVMEFNLQASDAAIEQARDDLSYTTIRSPIDGTITRINAEVGELVMTGTMNNAGTVIMQVADLSVMLLNAQVDEAAVGGVEVGQRAAVRINAYPGRVFEGTVQAVALSNDRATDGSKYYKTEILLNTQGMRIYSGLTADVEIETRRHEGILKVPTQAVLARPVDDLPPSIREDNPNVDMTKGVATVVYRMIDGKAVVTPVTIGASDASETVVLSGLEEADSVIVGPYRVFESLKHDQAVKDEAIVEKEKLDKQRKDEAAKKESATPSSAASDG